MFNIFKGVKKHNFILISKKLLIFYFQKNRATKFYETDKNPFYSLYIWES
jgi:hypothetical protein